MSVECDYIACKKNGEIVGVEIWGIGEVSILPGTEIVLDGRVDGFVQEEVEIKLENYKLIFIKNELKIVRKMEDSGIPILGIRSLTIPAMSKVIFPEGTDATLYSLEQAKNVSLESKDYIFLDTDGKFVFSKEVRIWLETGTILAIAGTIVKIKSPVLAKIKRCVLEEPGGLKMGQLENLLGFTLATPIVPLKEFEIKIF